MHVGSLDLLRVRALAMPVGSCKMKLGVEKRDADNFACAMALGPKIGPLAEVVGVAFYSFAVTPTSNVCWNRPARPTRTDATAAFIAGKTLSVAGANTHAPSPPDRDP